MAKKFLTPIGLVSLPSDPATGSEGQLYFNTTTDVVKIYSNGVWSELSGQDATIFAANQPDTTDLKVGTIWVDSDAIISTSASVVNAVYDTEQFVLSMQVFG
jgi:ABC-type thiamine transport system substrate-binding protein